MAETNLAEELKQLQANGIIKFSDIAVKTGVSRPAISQLANKGLHLKPEQEEKLWGIIREIKGENAQEELPLPEAAYKSGIELYETKEYKEAIGWCSFICSKRKLGVMVGHPGSGKTTILKQFISVQPGVIYIEAWHTMRIGDLMKRIAAPLGIILHGNSQDKVDAVMAALQERTDVMIAIDEAEYLCRRDVDKLELLRKIWDNTHTPMILCGTMGLKDLIVQGRGGQNLAQLYRRDYLFELKGIRPVETRSILKDYNVSPQAAEALTSIAADVHHGGMGTFVEVLELCLEAAQGGQITEAILASAKRYKLMY